MSGKACAVGVGAAMISRGNMTAACEMTRPSEMRAATGMPNRSVAAATVAPCRGVATATATTTAMAALRQCRSRARQNQS
jgi:hypothetical protein